MCTPDIWGDLCHISTLVFCLWLFNDDVSISDNVVLNDRMFNE
jgi:hypothetical protein